ncbi:hypothetical protein N7539_008249 [Penicillium diatomitis]|uniref:Uncharacterized protein n=1 Tax=Penicillium diatomitis TaxID=2819901 RepID=A0A9X0BNB0_9EURO|nr:uncharacterized protein N7539_008249 [Penicillium diatomitis]KAJ5475183.1 hypothetical protein N7539_008249 [Penicillium diatomitis]
MERGNDRQRDEILVHVSAPSTVRDDARYRAQVAAIRAFEPFSRRLVKKIDHDLLAVEEAPAVHHLPEEPASLGPELSHPANEHRPVCIVDAGNAGAQTMTAAAARIANSTPPREDRPPISPALHEENQIRPDPLLSTAARSASHSRNQTRDLRGNEETHIGSETQYVPESIESPVGVIPDSQPEAVASAVVQQTGHPHTMQPPRTLSPCYSGDRSPTRSVKRRRIEATQARPAENHAISNGVSASEIIADMAIPSDPAPREERISTVKESIDIPSLQRGASSDTHRPEKANIPPAPEESFRISACTIPPNSTGSSLKSPEHEPHRHHFEGVTRGSTSTSSIKSTEPKQHLLSSLPLTIHPPPPPISNSLFTTHVTPTLAMLTERLNPSRTYQPLHQTRDLDPLERGYWILHMHVRPASTHPSPSIASRSSSPQTRKVNRFSSVTSPSRSETWSEADFSRFWTFLCGFVEEARAGWGVWCLAERSSYSPSTSGRTPRRISKDGNVDVDKDKNKDKNTDTHPIQINPVSNLDNPSVSVPAPVQLVIKVYGWGEIARHVYLMLYLASERRVKGMGLKWVDPAEKVIIQMP